MLSIHTKKYTIPIVSSSSSSITTNTNRNWSTNVSATSSDGNIVYACASNDYLYKSIDGGQTFSPITSLSSSLPWIGISTSADGKYVLVCATTNNNLFLSTDGGITWTIKLSTKNWQSVGMSSTGQKMIACAYNDYVYISTDYGSTWVQNTIINSGNTTSFNVSKVSGDGNVFTVCYGYNVFKSLNDGTSWTQVNNLLVSTGIINRLEISYTGQYMTLCYLDTGLAPSIRTYDSSKDASGWSIKRTGSVFQTGTSISISSSGQYQTYTFPDNGFGVSGSIGVSSDYGVTFTTNPGSLTTNNWKFISMSQDGSKQFLGVSNTGIYKSTNSGSSFYLLQGNQAISSNIISYIPYSSSSHKINQ